MPFASKALTDDLIQVTLDGRLDIAGTAAIEQPFAFATTGRAARIIIDLSGVTFMTSIGIRLLVATARAQTNRGGSVVLAAAPPLVQQVLETAGIDQLIQMVATTDEARAAMALR